MPQILTGVQARILFEMNLDLVKISFDSLLQLDSNFIGLAFFNFIMALVKVSPLAFFFAQIHSFYFISYKRQIHTLKFN